MEKNLEFKCHDCQKEILVENDEIKNGFMLEYEDSGNRVKILKCKDCYDKNPSLANFRECEVYSRVVGYIRPIQQWHVGKKQEFSERKNYTN